MIDLDRTRLQRVLPTPLGSPDWADVMGRAHATGSTRRKRLVVLVVAALVAVGAASALAVRAFLVDEGFIGVPPVGATSSAPPSGTLVLSANGLARGSRTILWVYADGRIVWQREHPRAADLAVSANRESSGLLERRLTKRGVRLLQSAALSTGLLGRGLALTFDGQPCWNTIRARAEGRFTAVRWHGSQCLIDAHPPTGTRPASAREKGTLRTLFERLAYPASWLPPGAWRDAKPHAYVPSEFELRYGPWPATARPSAIRTALPAPARKLLGAKKPKREPVQVTRWKGGSPPETVPAHTYSYRVTTEEARSLSTKLAKAGLEADWRIEDFALAYIIEPRDPNTGLISIEFLPILPHGQAGAVGG